jgi:adenosine kinase
MVDLVKATGRCAVLVTDMDRSMVTDLQAANEFKISHLQKPAIWSLIENARFFYVGGNLIIILM